MATSLEFKIPLDPQPMPLMGSDDEESFVVLGKSLVPDVDLSLNNLQINPIQSGPIEEGKKLLNMELAQLEPSSSDQMLSKTVFLEEYDTTFSGIIKSSELTPEEVQLKVDSLIAENSKLRETIINNNDAMEAQHERIVAWKEEVQKTHQTHKEKFAEAKELISKLKGENKVLNHELEKSNEIREMQQRELFRLKDELKAQTSSVNGRDVTDNNSQSMNQNIQNEELIACKTKIVELEKLLQSYYLAKSKLEKENDSLTKHIKLLDEQKTLVDSSNDAQKLSIIELKEKLKDSENSITLLRNEVYCNVNLQEDLENTRKQLMSSQEAITKLQQTNSALLAQLAESQAKKVKESQDLESIKNDHFALQEQIKIYKADFESEREAKETIKNEKDQLMSDYLNIQKRNNQLNEELELVKERGFEVIRRAQNGSPSNATYTREEGRYTCPICSFGFSNIQALQNHVERCMDLSAVLP